MGTVGKGGMGVAVRYVCVSSPHEPVGSCGLDTPTPVAVVGEGGKGGCVVDGAEVEVC